MSSSRYAKPSRSTYNLIRQRRGLSSEQIARGRQQSSIEPKRFYGKKREYRVPPPFDSLPSITDEALTSVNKHRDVGRSENAKDIMTPLNSSSVSKKSNTRRNSTGAHVPCEAHVEDDWRPMFDDDEPMFPASSSSLPNQKVRSASLSDARSAHTSPSQSDHGIMDVRTKLGPQIPDEDPTPPIVPEHEVVQRLSKEGPESLNGRSQRPRSFIAQRRRYQSVPVKPVSSSTSTVNERDASPQPTQKRHDHALQELSNNAILRDMKNKLASFEKRVLERLPAMTRIQSAPVRLATAPTATAAAEDEDEDERRQQRRTKRVSDVERQLRYPKLNRNVPEHLRLPDEDIIEIGRAINGYEKHVQAPYAFSWRGRLYSRYKHLLARRDGNGSTVWSVDQISRMRG